MYKLSQTFSIVLLRGWCVSGGPPALYTVAGVMDFSQGIHVTGGSSL